MSVRTPFEDEVIGLFLQMAFVPTVLVVEPLPADEQNVVQAVHKQVEDSFFRTKYLLGLTVDFAMTAQFISCQDGHTGAKAFRPSLTEAQLFRLYPKKPKKGASGTQKTLSVTYADRKYIGIRRFEDRVVQLSRDLNRTSYPSAPPFNTQSWADFPEIMVMCFQLSEKGRWVLVNRLLDSLLKWLPEDKLFGRQSPRPRVFLEILRKPYTRNPGTRTENAGLTLQAITYGYIQADRGHLSISADKVRSGSSRQRRFGDVDGYFGIDIEVSVEVKDIAMTKDNWQRELGTFTNKVNYNQIEGLAVVDDITDEARAEMAGITDRVQVLTFSQLTDDVKLWDWRKQDNALNGMLHYLSHVEQNVFAVQRLLDFVAGLDPMHDMTAYREQAEKVAAVTDEVQHQMPVGRNNSVDGGD